MNLRHSSKYGKPIKVIIAGEVYASKSDELIGTILGSCVAVCLYDEVNKISGMNHFMLPGKVSKENIFQDRSAKYGIIAINELLKKLIEEGAEKKNIVAKIFGGGSLFEYEYKTIAIYDDNVRLAKVLLELEDIPITELDVGGKCMRKLLMDVKSGKVYLKKTASRKMLEKVQSEERKYEKRGFNA